METRSTTEVASTNLNTHVLNAFKSMANEEFRISYGSAKYVFFELNYLIECLKNECIEYFSEDEVVTVLGEFMALGAVNCEMGSVFNDDIPHIIYYIPTNFATTVH